MYASSNVIDIQTNAAFIMRRGLSDRLQYLSAQYPQVGFGVSLVTLRGDHYMLANPQMALPADKADGFPKGEQIAKFENGERFKSICVFADVPDEAIRQNVPEMELILDAIELIELIDTPSAKSVRKLHSEMDLSHVMNGTEG
ncbi:hypothetical protein [Aliiroseovarius sp. S253]|uniref:hypothetical protein n=1 Tax=Aliiroseovarius sp. S253 TaxID=3415133 RepID=UPI003C7C7ECE